jgi:hypothetical protein
MLPLSSNETIFFKQGFIKVQNTKAKSESPERSHRPEVFYFCKIAKVSGRSERWEKNEGGPFIAYFIN